MVRTRSRFITRGRQQQRRAIQIGSIFFLIHFDILLTPASMIFSERRAGGQRWQTRSQFSTRGRQLQRRAIHVVFIFFLIHLTFI
jgi:hypothetical protein